MKMNINLIMVSYSWPLEKFMFASVDNSIPKRECTEQDKDILDCLKKLLLELTNISYEWLDVNLIEATGNVKENVNLYYYCVIPEDFALLEGEWKDLSELEKVCDLDVKKIISEISKRYFN